MPPTNTPMTRWGFQTSSLKYSKTAAKKVSCLRFFILWKSHFLIYKNAQNPQKNRLSTPASLPWRACRKGLNGQFQVFLPFSENEKSIFLLI
jgi:hypothetical protein